MISLQHINIDLPVLDERKITQWIRSVVAIFDKKLAHINYIFCDNETILAMNRKYLQHDYYTDIISFDESQAAHIAGDIFISLETVRENADSYQVDYQEELLRIMIHGVLHFCGLKDDDAMEASTMRKHENQALAAYKTL